tara:strand:+ start:953 stop:1144 length:192 start_codon:yes stop_codon:yes gene_type:complete
MINHIILMITLLIVLTSCGKVGPLALPENKLDKSVISYPCDAVCMQKFEDEKQRQQSVILQTD